MTVRAKLKLTSVTEASYGRGSTPVKTLKFSAQYDNSIPEDQRFQKATPSGSCELQIDNPRAVEQFVLGNDYYVDFSPAE